MGEPQILFPCSLASLDQSLRGRVQGTQTLEYLPWVVFLTAVIDYSQIGREYVLSEFIQNSF